MNKSWVAGRVKSFSRNTQEGNKNIEAKHLPNYQHNWM